MATIEAQLYEIMNEFEEEMGEKVEADFKAIGKETATDLKQRSKALFHHRGKKHYADGWTSKVTGKGLDSAVKIFNNKKPGLTHLLENGHMILIDGHNYGRSRAFKHIEPAERQATQELLERLMKE